MKNIKWVGTAWLIFFSAMMVSAKSKQAEFDYAPSAMPEGRPVYASLPINPEAINVAAGNMGNYGTDFKNNFANHMNLWMSPTGVGPRHIEWLLNAPSAGVYDVYALAVGKGSHLAITCNDTKQEVALESKAWERVSVGTIPLKAGQNTLQLDINVAKGFKFDSLEIVKPAVKASLQNEALALRQTPIWFTDAVYGLMFQWTNRATPLKGSIKPWEEKVNDFDLAGFVDMVEQSGAAYVLWSITWGEQYISAPIQSLDAIIKGRTTKRDLLGEMADALHERGIKLIFYYHYGYDCNHSIDADWMKASGGYKADKTELYQNWMAIVSEIGERYGDKLNGWWFDGGQRYYNCHFDNSAADQGMLSAPFKELTLAAKAGNSERVVAYNSWVKPSLTEYQDYYAGEGAHIPAGVKNGVIPFGPQKGLLAHGCFTLEQKWGHIEKNTPIANPKYALDKLLKKVQAAKNNGYPLSINLEMYEDGSVSPQSVALLQKLNVAIRGK
jgi:hypothetical protein